MLGRLLSGRKKRPSEARESIRESLRIFRLIEKRLESRSKNGCGPALETPFEDLVAEQADFSHQLDRRQKINGIFQSPARSCGRTSRSFAALFFSHKQLLQNQIILHTNGSDLDQLWQNWNCVIYGWKRRNPQASKLLLGKIRVTSREGNNIWGVGCIARALSARVTEIVRNRAKSRAEALSESLFRKDPKEELPRVLFCNITWVLLQKKINDEDYDKDDASKHVKDHQWTIIKHTNNCFQIVQGYLAGIDGNGDSLSPLNDGERQASGGYCLSAWQNQLQNSARKGDACIETKCRHGTRFSSRHGFASAEMEAFLDRIRIFASSPRFDAGSYKSTFGQFPRESEGRRIWPAVSFRELDDDGIEGFGDRFIANRVERELIREALL